MADPKKQEKDFTKEVDALLPEVQSLATVRTLQPTATRIMVLSMRTRTVREAAGGTRQDLRS